MSGVKDFLCIKCGSTFIWAPAYSRHVDECTRPYNVELIAQYGRTTLNENGCWIWGRKLNKAEGYPSSSKYGYMHRLMYAVAYGDTDLDGFDVCHACDTPPCVNPEHLFKGTRQENMLDGVAKNGHWTAHASDEELSAWKQNATAGRQAQAAVARMQREQDGGDA